MTGSHHLALAGGYAAGLASLLVWRRARPELWPASPEPSFKKPWLEFALAAGAVLGVIAVGQAYQAGWLIPPGAAQPLREAANQIAIFAPVLVVPLIRRHSASSAWIPRGKLGWRAAVGAVAACAGAIAFALVRGRPSFAVDALVTAWRPSAVGTMTQVAAEDVAVAILLTRLGAAIGPRVACVAVGVLFAGAHVPALLASGATAAELGALGLDALLAVLVLTVATRTRDVIWVWCLHFTMDMTQFLGTG